jgi:hypothetical protein
MTAFMNFAKNSVFFGSFLSEMFFQNSLVVTVHLGTSLLYVHQVPKCPKVVHLGLAHPIVGPLARAPCPCNLVVTVLFLNDFEIKNADACTESTSNSSKLGRQMQTGNAPPSFPKRICL